MPDAWETGARFLRASNGAGFNAAGIMLKPFLKSPNSRLAAAQTADFLKTTQISASQESAPLLQSRSQPAPVSPAVRFRAGGSGGGVGRLAEVGIDEGWRIEWIPGSWMSHQRCAGWLGGKAEFPVV